MEELFLVRPVPEYADQIFEYRQEFLDAGDSMDGTGDLRHTENPYNYIDISLKGEIPAFVPPDRVAATQFLFVRECDDKLVGMIQVRHCLNEYLEKFGGHIGYSVRPSERRNGYASKMLEAVLPFCKDIGLEKLLLTCAEDNIGSEKTISANGGVYESTVFDREAGENTKRFWINL